MRDERLTFAEIADRYSASWHTVKKSWACHERWPQSVGKRGRAKEFDAGQVAAFVAEQVRPPAPEVAGDDDELIDIGQMSAMTGYSPQSLWSMVGHRRWPPPVGKRRKRSAAGEPLRVWESLWRLGEVRAELERREVVGRPGRRR